MDPETLRDPIAAGEPRRCKICGRILAPEEELYWDAYCEPCAAKSMDDWNEDFEKL